MYRNYSALQIIHIFTPNVYVFFKLRAGPQYALQYAWEVWKLGFISGVRPTVHTNPSRKLSLSKTLFKPDESKNAEFCFRVDENIS